MSAQIDDKLRSFVQWLMITDRWVYLRHKIGRLAISFEWRKASNAWGRFGGGWQWKLGFQYGYRCLIISLLVADLRIEMERKP